VNTSITIPPPIRGGEQKTTVVSHADTTTHSVPEKSSHAGKESPLAALMGVDNYDDCFGDGDDVGNEGFSVIGEFVTDENGNVIVDDDGYIELIIPGFGGDGRRHHD
jgi:hypothetical protein